MSHARRISESNKSLYSRRETGICAASGCSRFTVAADPILSQWNCIAREWSRWSAAWKR